MQISPSILQHCLVRPVCGPLARPLDYIDKGPCNDTIGLLARMRLVIPKEAVWALFLNACEAI